MPANDAKFKIEAKRYEKRFFVEKVRCPECGEGYLERNEHDSRFAMQDHFRSENRLGNQRVYTHECTKCKAHISLDECYPRDFEELVLVPEKEIDTSD